ncbi:MAG: hypothetical protein CVU39_16705 [Chloroflexi bacterium HGW-Chloroflexi-10]|nr:MAG: hypothetical protein CVU39_16705 [Chloroflexi bacterium HGW-Chloroflexi-10]
MKTQTGNRTPILQSRVNEYLLITLISFAASVSGTRLFLELTGYPQLGGGELHIAHVLWGGLFLFVGSLLPLTLTNRWALDLSALFSGLGVGLFIDEVGKFITQSNDYFYPSAAPIIYAFFLLTVLLYVQVKRPREQNARSYLYNAFQDLEELLDNDLSINEHRAILKNLKSAVAYSKQPQLSDLAQTLHEYLINRELQLVPHKPSFIQQWVLRIRVMEAKWFSKSKMRMILVISLIAWGIYSIMGPWTLLSSLENSSSLNNVLEQLFSNRVVRNASGLTIFQARVALEGALGGISLICGILLLFRRESFSIRIGIANLLVTLTIANLLLFYFDQFSTILNASIQFLILVGLIRYQSRFLSKIPLKN